MRRCTRSQAIVVDDIIPQTAVENPELSNIPIFFALENVRPFGGTIRYTYSMMLWIKSAHANGNLRGNLYGLVRDMRIGGETTGQLHSTTKIVEFFGNRVKSSDGIVYSIESVMTQQERDNEPCFELKHLEGRLDLPAFSWL